MSRKSVQKVKSIIRKHPRVKARVAALRSKGFTVKEDVPMGSGGVGQVKTMSNGDKRIQVGYGKGRWNYAPAVVIKSKRRG